MGLMPNKRPTGGGTGEAVSKLTDNIMYDVLMSNFHS